MPFSKYLWYTSVLLGFMLLPTYTLTAQCTNSYTWAAWQSFSNRQATGTAKVGTKTVGVTMTANYDFFSANSIYKFEVFSGFSDYSHVPNTTVPATEWYTGGTTTICFSEPVTNPVLLYASLGRANPGDYEKVSLKFSQPYTVLYDAGGTTFSDAYSLYAYEGNAILLFPGTFSCLTIYSEGTEYNTNLNIGLQTPPFPVTIADTKGCDKVVLTAQGGATYKWNGGDNPTSAANTVRTSGVYSVTATDQNGCTSIAVKAVTITPKSSLTSTVSRTICQGDSYAGYKASGTYTDSFKTPEGCDSLRTLTLSVLDIPKVTFDANKAVCSGQSLALTPSVTPTNAQLAYRWSTGATDPQISVTQAGVYSLTVANGSCTATAATSVTVNQIPSIKPDEKVCLSGSTVTLYSGAAAPALTYHWQPTNSTDSTLTVSQLGKYTITVTTPAGCQASRSIDVRGAGFCSATILAPDLFTPNGDQVNDLFNVVVVDGSPIRLTVYDRWGSVIFSEENSNPRWDGTYKGTNCLTGIYPYVLTYKSTNGGEVLQYRSKLTLMR